MLTYHDLTHHIVPGPQTFSYFVPLLLLPVALLIPRSLLARWQSASLFMPVFMATTLHAWWKMDGVDVISVDVLLWASFLLVLRDPWSEFRYIQNSSVGTCETGRQLDVAAGLLNVDARGEVDEPTALAGSNGDYKSANRTRPPTEHALSEQSYPATLWERIPWVGTLLVSIRLNNWIIGSAKHDKSQPPAPAFSSRRAFVGYTLLCFTRGYLTLDLTRSYIDYDRYFTNPDVSITSPLPFHELRFLPPRMVRTMVVGAQAWSLIGQMFYLPCLLPVGLHALGLLSDEWSPHLWPPYYGSPRQIFLHGVRGFWGQFWHQTMRWSVSAPGYAIADALRLGRSSMKRYSVVTIVAFGLSGAIHMGLVPPEPLHATREVNQIRLCVAEFFWLQPVAILGEVLIARVAMAVCGQRYWQSGSGLVLRLLANAIWVVTWFTFSLPLLGEFGRQLGYWRAWPIPISIWRGLQAGQWIAWPFLEGR